MKKTETKVEMKKNVLPGNPLELDEAALESVAGGTDGGMELTGEEGGVPESVRNSVIERLSAGPAFGHVPGAMPEQIEIDPEQQAQMMERVKELEEIAKRQLPY